MEIKPNHIKPRWRKVLADLWDSKTRTLLVVASIAVGVFSIGMIVTAYTVMAEDLNLSYASANPVNIEIVTDPFDEDLLRIVERVEGVKAVEGRRIFSVRASGDGEEWLTLKVIAVDDFRAMNMNRLKILEGTQYPERHQLLISQDYMNNTGYQVGDLIEIQLPDGTTEKLPLVGIVGDQVTDMGDFTAGPKLYIRRDSLNALGFGDAYLNLYITVAGDGGDEAYIEAVADRVEERIERNHRTVYRTKTLVSTEHPMEGVILATLGVLGALGGLVTLLSSSLIINTLNALLTQHMRQIGIMKLIGGRSRQILSMYMTLIFSYGLIALVIAVPTGGAAGYELARFMAFMMNSELLGFRYIPNAIGLQVLLAFLIPLGAGFFPVNRGSKINVRRAISTDRPGATSSQSSLIDRLTALMRFISRPILLSIRNTFRQKGRLTLTIITLTVAGSIFIAVFNVRGSMENMMDMLMAHFMGDVTIYFEKPYPITRVKQVVLPVPGVTGLEGWGGAGVQILDEEDNLITNMNVIAAPADTQLLDVDIVAGRWLQLGEEKNIVVSDSIYDDFPDFKVGDTLNVKMPGYRAEEWTVVGIFRFINMLGDPLAYADYDFIANRTRMEKQAVSFRVITVDHSLEGQLAVSGFLDQYLKDRGFKVARVEAGQNLQEDNSQAINILVIFLLIMALLTAFVGSIGLTGTMGMNVLERTREIGVMRAIGAVDLEVIKSVVIEGVLIGLITWVMAIGLSFPISSALLKIVSEAMRGSSIRLVFTYDGIVIWLGVVVMLSFLASILPARNAARLTIQEVLSYE